MLNTLHRRARDEKGFTLIELLVVILIIGILAAIAIPAFLGQRARAQDTEGKSAVREAQTAIETYAVDQGGKYAGADDTKLKAIENSLTNGAGDTLTVTGVADDTYVLEVTAPSKNLWKIEKKAGGIVQKTCTKKNDRGSCPTSGATW